MHFIFVLIELFSLGLMAEVLRANIDWKSAFFEGGGSRSAKFSRGKERPPPNQPFLHGPIGQSFCG